MSPEVIEGNYDNKCDVWSCGIILYIMLCGHPPFNGKTESEIFGKISRGVFNFSGKHWNGVSKEAKNLIQKMLSKDVNKRPSAKEAWNDIWIQSRTKGEIEDHPIDIKTLNKLAEFSTNSRLQQATLGYIASNLITSQEISELKNAFVVLDMNGDGHLSLTEISMGYANISLSSSVDFQRILERCDIDQNGMIDYNEFITATLDWNKKLTNDLLESVFKAYDKDKSGTISLDEIKEFLGEDKTNLHPCWDNILRAADSNGDGVIDLDEFKRIIISQFQEDDS